MKILMLGWELPPHNSGGLGVACMNLTRALTKGGAEIDFVVPYSAEHPDANFHILSATQLGPLDCFNAGAYESKNIEAKIITSLEKNENISIRDVQETYCKFILDYLSKNPLPDAIHAHDWLTFEAGMLAKKRFDLPLIAHVHATEYDRSGMNGGNPLIHEIEKQALDFADQIIAVSNATKNIIHEKYHIPLEKIDVLHNSLDENFIKSDYEFTKEDYKYIASLKKRGYTIVSTVGRFTIQKGLTHMMRAAARALEKNKKLMFVFAGDGEERNELISLASSLGISKNVIFTGFIRGKKLRDIYEISDIFVMSSVSEPFGLTALEAAHHGDVLILTKQSGVAEVLRSAFSYDFWDEYKLADEILALAENPVLMKTLKNDLKKEYRKISWEKVAEKCLSIYDKYDKKSHQKKCAQ